MLQQGDAFIQLKVDLRDLLFLMSPFILKLFLLLGICLIWIIVHPISSLWLMIPKKNLDLVSKKMGIKNFLKNHKITHFLYKS